MTLPLHTRHLGHSSPCEEELRLVERVRRGDSEAFRVLFVSYREPLAQFGERLTGTRDTAEDIVQEVFTAIWERRSTWEVTSGVHRYFYGAVRNRAFDIARHGVVQAQCERLLVLNAPERSADPAEIDDIRGAVARVIEQLPVKCRAVYRLRHYHELTYAEIAHVLQLSVKTVEMHVTAASKILRKRLQFLR